MTKIWGRIMIQIGGYITRRFRGIRVIRRDAESETVSEQHAAATGFLGMCLGIRDLQRLPTVLEEVTRVGPLSGVSRRYADRVGQPKIF